MRVGIIHAKGTSERVPNKNLRLLGDKPLFCHILDTALTLSPEHFDKVIIDSDNEEILNIGAKRGAIPLKRYSALATNRTDGHELMYWGAINYPDSDVIVSLLPTSPFISEETMIMAVSLLKGKNWWKSVISVREEPLYIWKGDSPVYNSDKIPNSFSMEKTIYETTGLYACKTNTVLYTKKRFCPKETYLLKVPKIEAIDINEPEDFELAEIVYKGLE